MRMPGVGRAVVALTPLLLSAGILPARAEKDRAQVTLRKSDSTVKLPRELAGRLAGKVRSLARSCSLSSVDDPGLFPEDPAAAWDRIRSGPHLQVRYLDRFTIAGAKTAISAAEVLIGLDDESFLGPLLTRQGETIVSHVKCSGYQSLELMCLPELAPHFPPGYQRNCRLVK